MGEKNGLVHLSGPRFFLGWSDPVDNWDQAFPANVMGPAQTLALRRVLEVMPNILATSWSKPRGGITSNLNGKLNMS